MNTRPWKAWLSTSAPGYAAAYVLIGWGVVGVAAAALAGMGWIEPSTAEAVVAWAFGLAVLIHFLPAVLFVALLIHSGARALASDALAALRSLRR